MSGVYQRAGREVEYGRRLIQDPAGQVAGQVDGSTFSAAGAEILRRWTHSDNFGAFVAFAAGSSVIEPGVTPASPVKLYWATFTDAANQAGISRQYGGSTLK